ncbi:hypothetical protein CEXT_113161 [Caerostris extrusa]|uniref:Uncharacterized protein n=1 Tax=Caerostris extrusa TaxID=172846 RepID=A0AAV4XS37_CAEEX|nr:hypothetical protein CEXT_113161 [Caerostris extrusa]
MWGGGGGRNPVILPGIKGVSSLQFYLRQFHKRFLEIVKMKIIIITFIVLAIAQSRAETDEMTPLTDTILEARQFPNENPCNCYFKVTA